MSCRQILSTLFLALVFVRSFAQGDAAASTSLSEALVKWNTKCTPRECSMHTDVLRGDSGSPADPRDPREYVGISVVLERRSKQPTYIAFYVDPRATRNQGIFIEFARTTKSKDAWSIDLDDKSMVRIPIASCGTFGCFARVSKGIEVKRSTGQQIDLMNKFLTSDEVLILYIEGQRAYRTMVPLATFHRDYEKIGH